MSGDEPSSASSQKPLPERSAINNAIDWRGNTLLHDICGKAETTVADIVRAVAGGADVNALNNSYLPPLSVAIMAGNAETVAALIGLGAELYFRLPNGKAFNATLMAVHRNDQSILGAVLSAGGGRFVNESGIDNNGADGDLPCLHLAAQKDKVALVDPLIDAGALADTLCGAPCPMAALHYAAQNSWVHMAAKLVRCGVTIDIRDHEGRTPLYLAADMGRGAVAETLLSLGADPASANNDSKTVLMAACAAGNVDIVRLLVETYKVDVQTADKTGKTALMYAANKNSSDCVKILLAAGADPLLTDAFNKSALSHSSDSEGTYYEKNRTREMLKTAEDTAAADSAEKKYKKYRP